MEGEVKRGYFGVGMWQPKTADNLGGLIRSANAFNADFVFTIGNRYKRQPTDTAKATRHMPLFHYENETDFLRHVPDGCNVIGIEITENSKPLEEYVHPERAIYLLGGEDRTLPAELLKQCQTVRSIDTKVCLNVAGAATVVLYDRNAKRRVSK